MRQMQMCSDITQSLQQQLQFIVLPSVNCQLLIKKEMLDIDWISIQLSACNICTNSLEETVKV